MHRACSSLFDVGGYTDWWRSSERWVYRLLSTRWGQLHGRWSSSRDEWPLQQTAPAEAETDPSGHNWETFRSRSYFVSWCLHACWCANKTCSRRHLWLWSLRRQGLHHVLQVLRWTAYCWVTVRSASPGVKEPLGAQDSPRGDGRVS